MKRLITMLTILLFSCAAYSQIPANDNCSTAQNLGTLPTPATCPSGVGAAVNVAGTSINATAPSPYSYLLGCQTGGNQPAPALDVWYSFVASGNQANITITPGSAPVLANPAITLWNGSNCASLIGYGCDNNGTAGGNNTALFQPLTPGQTYYIQISGMGAATSGNFNLAVNASNDCNNCLQTSSLTVSPAAVSGAYLPGTTVTFCYTISSYTQVSSNWLHGVIPTFGNGWNLATLTTVPAVSCSGNGSWSWFNTWTSSATSVVFGPGFAYDYTTAPGNPGNNFGDNNSVACTWTFCWSIQTKPNCLTGSNLNISINTTGDGESGSWSSIACQGDPNYLFGAVLNCCTTTATFVNPTCFGGTNGTATANPAGIAPYTYSWNTIPIQTTQTATGLPAGTYTVTVTDNTGCVSTATVTLTTPPAIIAGPMSHN